MKVVAKITDIFVLPPVLELIKAQAEKEGMVKLSEWHQLELDCCQSSVLSLHDCSPVPDLNVNIRN